MKNKNKKENSKHLKDIQIGFPSQQWNWLFSMATILFVTSQQTSHLWVCKHNLEFKWNFAAIVSFFLKLKFYDTYVKVLNISF